ncbi:hypothetical protein RRG08_039508 [Elysia crispata]|uniref:protein-tyrosine-phosphatase n=1 Tax=Elysia crispata TaxID=231223 RepID=A0AAE0YK93_9GAST|nr:hypothetical protein RRG08_039508 [Elysia crispata]
MLHTGLPEAESQEKIHVESSISKLCDCFREVCSPYINLSLDENVGFKLSSKNIQELQRGDYVWPGRQTKPDFCCPFVLLAHAYSRTIVIRAKKMSEAVQNKEYLDQSDLSDKEDAETLDLSPFKVDWLDLEFADCHHKLGISALPGCRFKDTWRSMTYDIDCLKGMKIEEVFCFCTKGDLYMYRATDLLNKYAEAGINCHHYPIEDGHVPEMAKLMGLLDEIKGCLTSGKKTLLHCYGGIGRSCAVAACLLMVLDPTLSQDDAKQRLKDLKGDAAIRSVKQYNFVTDFRTVLTKYLENQENRNGESRSVSR